MAVTSAVTTLSPAQFAETAEVFGEDFREVVEFLNWVVCNKAQLHVSLGVGFTGLGTKMDAALAFPEPTEGWQEYFRFRIRVNAETQRVHIGARCTIASGWTGLMRMTVGAAAAFTYTYTNANNGSEIVHSFVTSSTGTGEIEVLIELAYGSGGSGSSGSPGRVDTFRVEDDNNTVSSIPDPQDT